MEEDFLSVLAALAMEGYGVVWSNVHNEYRPFEVDAKDDTVYWWHDPLGCANTDFETSVRATHNEMLRQIGP